jgi:hypothetical protein
MQRRKPLLPWVWKKGSSEPWSEEEIVSELGSEAVGGMSEFLIDYLLLFHFILVE